MKYLLSLLFSIVLATTHAEGFPAKAIATARRASVMVFSHQHVKGGGVVVDKLGSVLTACHLVDSTNAVLSVRYSDGRWIPARIVAVDVQADLMLLEPETEVPDAAFAELVRAEPEEGEEQVCVGPALWEMPLTTYGRAASEGPRYREFSDKGFCSRFRAYNAMTPQLFSGSGWFTHSGRLAGIQSGYINNLGKTEMSGIAMVASLDDIKRLVSSRHDAATPDIGGIVFELWSAAREHIDGFAEGSEGVLLTKRAQNGALATAGIPHLALIQSVDNRVVKNRVEFFDALRLVGPGNETVLGFYRLNGEHLERAQMTFESLEAHWWRQWYPTH